jgi:tyrosine-protein phosphatase YwqE
MENTLQMCSVFEELGYRKVITTPHIYPDIYPNEESDILERLRLVQQSVQEEGFKIKIEAAAEYYLDETFMERIESGRILTFGGKFILFETGYLNLSPLLNEAIFNMQTNGYTPVLAHPERYLYLMDDKSLIRSLKDRGVLFQLNLLSFAGYYARGPKQMARQLWKEQLVDFIGSDCHNMEQLKMMKKAMNQRIFSNASTAWLLNRSLYQNSEN